MTKDKFIEKVRYYLSDEYLNEKKKWADSEGLPCPGDAAYYIAGSLIKEFLEEVEEV